MLCFKNQGPASAESQGWCKMEWGKKTCYCTVLNFCICMLVKMVCQVTILIKSLLSCKSYNYSATTPGSIKIKDLAPHYSQDTRETLLLIHHVFKQTSVSTELCVCLQTETSCSAAEMPRTTGHLAVSSDSWEQWVTLSSDTYYLVYMKDTHRKRRTMCKTP